uniref:Zgc:113276 n=1 Tax=Hucho hucho TaxID=62062 RepID=A0A4W5Q646_9TELE
MIVNVDKYGLDSVLTKGTVDRLSPVMSEGIVTSFKVFLQNGDVLEARRVVMATGPSRAQMANIPFWVSSIAESYPEERLQHTVQLMHHHPASQSVRQQEPGSQNQEQEESSSSLSSCGLRAGPYVVCEPGQRVVVVGGGLTSAHIISIALQQGASHVTWVMRRHLQLKQFDVGDVESLVGRYSHVEHGIKMDGLAYLRQFYNESSVHKRLAMIRQARKGGAVTPEAYAALQPYIQTGQLAVRAYCQVQK